MSIVYYVPSLAGSGKTFAATRHTHKLAQHGHKVLLVQPSVRLIQQTLADLTSLNPSVPCRAIFGSGAHGAGTSSNVVGDIIEHLRSVGTEGEVLLITHAAFLRLPYFHRPDRWRLLIDEVPQADWCDELAITETHHLITVNIDAETDESGLVSNRYARITPKHRTRLEAMLTNKSGDEVWNQFAGLLGKLLSQHWRTYVLDDQFNDLLNGVGDPRSLWSFAVLKPSLVEGFASATIMGACFKETTLYHLWLAQGVEFRPHKRLLRALRYNAHGNGNLLTIHHAAERDWSKTLRNTVVSMSEAEAGAMPRTVLDSVVASVAATFTGAPFVWMGNKDLRDDLFGANGIRLPNSPHGLNQFQQVHNVAVLSALNPPPAHFAFLAAAGVDSADVKRACYWQAVYQAAMRASLRNPDDMTPKTVVVMDRATADWLADMFPGCTVTPLAGMDGVRARGKAGRPRAHLSNADRKAANRDRFRLELATELDLVNGREVSDFRFADLARELRDHMTEFGRGRDQVLTARGRSDLGAMAGTVFTSIFDATPFDYMPREDVEAFIAGLLMFHGTEVPNKEANGLVSPSIFDPALSDETKRGLDNIRACWGIWLDNDGGDLTPDAFARTFPRLRMAIFNSYSSTAAAPRWRVFLPTTCAMSIAAYRAVVGQIMLIVNEAGYWSRQQLDDGRTRKSPKHHGFDMSKLVPSSLFYLPCQAKDPTDSFFIDLHDSKRVPLDPYQWAKFAANRLRPEPEVMPPAAAVHPARPIIEVLTAISPELRVLRDRLRADQANAWQNRQAEKRDAAVATWRTAPAGDGNHAFFVLGSTLVRLGLARGDVEAILRQEANSARSPRERRDQIAPMLRKLRSSTCMLAA